MVLTGRVLLPAHIDAISESEYSDEELSDSTVTWDRSVCLGSFVNMFDFPINLLDIFLFTFLGFIMVVFMAEGPPTSITLLMPWGSNVMTLDFTILAAEVYSVY
jgi:hypothetical protein